MFRKPLLFRLLFVPFMVIGSLTACEKADYYEDSEGKQEQIEDIGDTDDYDLSEKGDTINDDDDESTVYHSGDTLTVDEFIKGNYEGGVFVKGYVIGDCTKRFDDENAEFAPPFSHPQALLLADEMSERSSNHIISIRLRSGSTLREHMNLVDNPAWYGKVVIFSGVGETYLGIVGIKDVGSYPTYEP